MLKNEQNLPELAADLSPDDRIDVLCDEFESAWRSGDRPDLRAYLNRVNPEGQARLFVELILVDWELRSSQHDQPTWNDYQTRFPDFAEQIETVRFVQQLDGAPSVAADYGKGRRIAHFELIERIGEGAAGEVWKASDPRLRRLVAIKLPRSLKLSERELNRFLREGQTAAQLHHSGIVPVFEVGRDGDRVYIASAYIAGTNLRNWLMDQRLSPLRAAAICRLLAEALHHAHEHDVVHRDLKPGNILIDDAGQPYITDFGLAKWSRDSGETLEGQLLGTLAYMSPEQARGKASEADRRSDVYALGVILYEMLTGQCPFDGDHASVVYKILHQEPRPPRALNRTIPRDLETICLKAMEKAPQRRYLSAQEMSVDLQRFLQGEPVLARRTSRVEKTWRWMRRRPAAAALMAVASVSLALLGLSAWLWGENHSLLGLQTVDMRTDPAGARLAIAPLDSSNQPRLDRIVRPRSRTPVQVELPPGNYLVVAVLDDGRFHEVIRRIPKATEGLSGVFGHNHWKILEDGSVELVPIKLPPLDVAQGMIRLSTIAPEAVTAPDDDLYVDSHECTVAEFQVLHGGHLPLDRRSKPDDPNGPVALTYDEALHVLERLGKRLPTEAEFERIFLTQQNIASLPLARGFHPTATAGFRQVGLPLGAALWTMSKEPAFDSLHDDSLPSIAMDSRIVRGGTMADGRIIPPPAMPADAIESRLGITRAYVQPGLGFRGVRGTQPRFFPTESR